MKKFLVLLCGVLLVLGMVGSAGATLVSFLYEDGFAGVDNTTGWQTTATGSPVNLGITSFTILGGLGEVASVGGTITHRAERGLGVSGEENDEVDALNGVEEIWIRFTRDVYLNELTVRSLFANETLPTGGTANEWCSAQLFLDGGSRGVTGFHGLETSGNGESSWVYADYPMSVDAIKFYVGSSVASYSEFAVASIDVTVAPVPEPATMLLLGTGLVGLAGLRKRFKK